MIGLQMGVHASPYVADEFNAQKKAFWALHATFIGCMMAPLVAMFGDVVAQAALYTGGLAGGISALGWVAPSKDSFNMMAPLAMGMGLVLVAAMASPFFSPTSPAGGALFSFVLWGGMILSGGLMFFHTQQMLSKAERHPLHHAKAYDPISASMGMYIAMVNMFQRLLFILGANKRK
jgi:FtsH-binding integral membrane protein